MDINLARTFLMVAETGSFIDAAHRLNITQSTVSARINGLEVLLGRPVFERSKSGADLTAAGECAPLNIRVNTVNPAPIETRMMRSLETGFLPGQPDAAKAKIRDAGIPTPDWFAFNQAAFRELGAADALGQLERTLGFPLVVKPSRGGSSPPSDSS